MHGEQVCCHNDISSNVHVFIIAEHCTIVRTFKSIMTLIINLGTLESGSIDMGVDKF